MRKSNRLKPVCALVAAALLLLTALPVGAQSGKTRRVRFPRGRTSAILKGAVVRATRDKYILGARGGQTMIVHLSSLERNASFTIYSSGGSDVLGGAEDVTDWSGELPYSGDWVIEVGPTRGNATYTLEVTIR